MTNYTTTDHYNDFNVLSWQPIDTAPKDGTSILVYRRWKKHHWLDHGYDHYIEIAYWKDDDWWIHAFCPPASNDPSHWMPLPEPPNTDK